MRELRGKKINKLQAWWRSIRYPENVFWGRTGIKRATALSSVGPGWAKLINNLYDAKPRSVRVVQVKEKFGGLRFYINGAPEWYHDLISAYEHESYGLCERCGKKGVLREDLGWILTLCDEDYKAAIEKRKADLERWEKRVKEGKL